MAVLIELATVVILNSALERRFPGGVAALAQRAPNSTFHSDGQLSAVSFMVLDDVKAFVGMLTQYGFSDPWSARSEDLAVVDQRTGLLTPCDWLKIDLRRFNDKDGKLFGATIAWVGSEEPATVAAPDGWYPRRAEPITQEDVEQNYELVKAEVDPVSGGAVIAYRHRETGQMKYIARTAPPGYRELQERYHALAQELATVMDMPALKRTDAAAKLYERATTLVEETEAAWGPLLVQGVAARLAGRWSKAEPAFRKITELWPDCLDAWLELTWTLASLGRLGEAEEVARRAVEIDSNSPAAHFNLASTLLQRGRLEEALLAAQRARQLNPSDRTIVQLLQQVREALEQQPADRETHVPWYKRWFR